MKIHGQYGWTLARRMQIAVALIDAARKALNTPAPGHIAIVRDYTQRARYVLTLNADLLDARVALYYEFMPKGE